MGSNNSGFNFLGDVKKIFIRAAQVGCMGNVLLLALSLVVAFAALSTPMMMADKVVQFAEGVAESVDETFESVKDTVSDATDALGEFGNKLWNFACLRGWVSDEESFNNALKDEYEKYKKKGITLDIRLIQAIVFYDAGVDENEEYDCEIPEDADPNSEEFQECIPGVGNADYDYAQLRSEVHELADSMVEDGALKDEEEFQEWLKDNFIEDKLKSLDYSIPSSPTAKEKVFDDFIRTVYEKKGLYEEALGESEENNMCIVGTGEIITADQVQNLSRNECIELFGPLAASSYQTTNVFASLTLAQIIQEANCGKSTPPNSNNVFGIKCSSTKFSLSTWDGSCTTPVSTSEEDSGGNSSTIKASFRKYKSINESILDHAALLSQGSSYKKQKVTEATDPFEQARRIKAAGYATDADYAETLAKVIRQYNLEKWDIVTGNNDCIADSATLVPGSYHKPIVYFNQGDYPNDRYGSYGTIKSHGCGPTSMAIIISSMTGQTHDPIEMTNLACNSGLCTSNGSSHSIAKVLGEKFGLKVSGEISQDAAGQQQVVDALSSGKSLVLTLQGPGIFTKGGHFLVLVGVTNDKKIQVADPGSRNRTNQTYTMAEITRSQKKWWIITEP